ncbi:hypothetical protein B5S28_g528 [[Candida] boidinii]|nr:hypothetical protein B5S28_g528 [[Candida] boidinii]OWB59177.1 hypothetical protein B5S29_g31 [[Candida] boidinii]OWB70442.1 hypothetical protein B5S31_g120 [[Candida] boidinii]
MARLKGLGTDKKTGKSETKSKSNLDAWLKKSPPPETSGTGKSVESIKSEENITKRKTRKRTNVTKPTTVIEIDEDESADYEPLPQEPEENVSDYDEKANEVDDDEDDEANGKSDDDFELPKTKKRGRPRKGTSTTSTTSTTTKASRQPKRLSANNSKRGRKAKESMDSKIEKAKIEFNDKKYEEIREEILYQRHTIMGYLRKTGLTRKTVSQEYRLLHSHNLTQSYARKRMIVDSNFLHSLFHFNNKAIAELSLNEFPELVEIPKASFKKITPDVFKSSLELTHDVKFLIDNGDAEGQILSPPILESDGIKTLPNADDLYRHGSVINSGGLPVTAAWLSNSTDDYEYLFVSVTKHQDSASVPELSFSAGGKTNSALILYRVHRESCKVEILKKYLFGNGIITQIKFCPEVSNKEPNTSIMAFRSTDNNLYIFKLEMDDKVETLSVEDASIVISIPNFRIVSFEWISEREIVLGLSRGFIALVDIESPNELVYIHQVALNDVVGISSNATDNYFENQKVYRPAENILISTTNSRTYLVDLRNLSSPPVESQIIRFPTTNISYSAIMNTYAVFENSKNFCLVGKRDPSDSFIMAVTETDIITAGALSTLTPFAIFGFSSGELHLLNLSIREIANPKVRAEQAPAVRLLKMEYSHSLDAYRLDSTYNVERHQRERNSNFLPTPLGCNYTHVQFNNSQREPSMYSACLANGLIVIEKLASTSLS